MGFCYVCMCAVGVSPKMKRRKNGEVMVFIRDFRYDHSSGDLQANYDEANMVLDEDDSR